MIFPFPVDVSALLESWLSQPQSPAFWWQLGVLTLAAGGALLVHRTLSQSLGQRPEGEEENAIRRLTLSSIQRLLFPISMLFGVLAGRALLDSMDYPVKLLNLAVPLLASLATIRISVYFEARRDNCDAFREIKNIR